MKPFNATVGPLDSRVHYAKVEGRGFRRSAAGEMCPALGAILLLGAITTVRAEEPRPPAGFTPLLNGRDLTGWKADAEAQRHWTIKPGGILDYALESRVKKSARLETPDLDIRYDAPADSGFMRGDYARPVK